MFNNIPIFQVNLLINHNGVENNDIENKVKKEKEVIKFLFDTATLTKLLKN